MTEFSPTTQIQDEVLNFLLTAPSPQAIIEFHASDMAQDRLRYLLDVNRNGTISDIETAELDEAEHMNHLIILLKAKAHKAL
jgi:hypothetical protein